MTGHVISIGTGLVSILRLRSSEGGSCRRCGLFNSAAVVILMAGKGCPARKCLLTVGIRALVRPLSRVRASVPS